MQLLHARRGAVGLRLPPTATTAAAAAATAAASAAAAAATAATAAASAAAAAAATAAASVQYLCSTPGSGRSDRQRPDRRWPAPVAVAIVVAVVVGIVIQDRFNV